MISIVLMVSLLLFGSERHLWATCGLDQALFSEEWLHLFDIVVAMECARIE
jgi:hypothetical protein